MAMRFLIFFLFISVAGLHAQDLDNFVSLKSSGEIPKDFTTLSSQKFEIDRAENTNKELDKDFFLSTRFFIDELLLSGKVIFNDPVTIYINKVADYILADEPELRKKLRFYTLKTNTPNAFSTDQGVVLVTTGLIAQLENEAQLGFILCHEIIHYIEKHVRNGYVENKNITKGRGEYSGLSYRSRISQLSKYSKDLEFEADKQGIDMYLKSEYPVEEIFSAFEVLLYSYLPFDDVQFDSTFFNTPNMVIPGSFFPDTVNEVSQEADYKDDGHTHPNIQRRMDKAFDHLGDRKSLGEKKFVMPEEDFKYVRNLCRFENTSIYIAEREYVNALYSIFLLKREFPSNRFLDLAQVKALYGLVKYKNFSRYNEVTVKPNKVEGESFPLHIFFKNLTKEQLNVIAFRHAYDMTFRYKDDKVFISYYEDLKRELAIRSMIAPSKLKTMSYEQYMLAAADTTKKFNIEDSMKRIDDSELSKYEKIRRKKELKLLLNMEDVVYSDKEFHLYALWDLVSQEDLLDELKDIKTEYQDEQDRLWEEGNFGLGGGLIQKSQHLGIHTLVVVDPIYEDYKMNDSRNHEKSEDNKLSLSEIYEQNFDNLNLQTKLVDSKNLESSDLEEYNDLGILNQWVGEIVDHDMEMICSTSDQMTELTDKYQTTHFLFSGVYAYKYRGRLGIPHNYFELVAFCIDADTDEIEFITVQNVSLKGNARIVRAYIYDILYQLSSRPKAKIELP